MTSQRNEKSIKYDIDNFFFLPRRQCQEESNNNNNNKVYPNPRRGQHALALIGWFERAVILCGGTKAQKQQSHRSNSGCWTGVLVTLIRRLCSTDPYSFMKENVISIEKVSC